MVAQHHSPLASNPQKSTLHTPNPHLRPHTIPPMKLLPIHTHPAENQAFHDIPECVEALAAWEGLYPQIGFHEPWIGYFVEEEGEIIGGCGYKGPPVAGTIEIAYGLFPAHEGKGFGKQFCKLLVELSLATDPTIRITARTLPVKNASGSILIHNGFHLLGTVEDKDDGEVWEWEFRP